MRGKGYRIFAQGVQLEVIPNKYYCYPDVAVTFVPADFEAERTLTAPTVVVEVVSAQTAARNRGWKFKQYKQLPSLKHYLLVSQDTCLVEWYRREVSGVWGFVPLVQLADELDLADLCIKLKVSELYDEIDVSQTGFHSNTVSSEKSPTKPGLRPYIWPGE